MRKISLSSSAVERGEPLGIVITDADIPAGGSVRVSVFEAGLLNCSWRYGSSLVPAHLGNGNYRVEVQTDTFEPGFYQIPQLSCADRADTSSLAQANLLQPNERLVFEVIKSGERRRSSAEVLQQVARLEERLQQEFLEPFVVCTDIEQGTLSQQQQGFSTFVFVRNLLIGNRIRFPHYELVPTGNGLDERDSVDFVNRFLAERTLLAASFEYNGPSQEAARNGNPVCVVHFPNIVAFNEESVLTHCSQEVATLLLALALSRDSSGEIFSVVIFNRSQQQVKLHSRPKSYYGNLVTGAFAGEGALRVNSYLDGLSRDSMSRFLVELYTEAQREEVSDFKYIRYWQILEMLADAENYDRSQPLKDYEGKLMMDGERTRRVNSAVERVFSLIRDLGIGNTETTWENVNVWFAFRSAVAHHGAVGRFEQLDREYVKQYARRASQQIKERGGHDHFLWSLKEEVKLILSRRLGGNTAAT